VSKIDLTTISSGYLTAAQLNNNFMAIESEFNDKVLYRENPVGETNQMSNNLDMNSFQLLNLPKPVDPTNAVRLQDIGDASSFADAAEQSAIEAAASAAEAFVSENNASSSATDSSNSASASLASENKAEEWAQNPEDVPVETGPDQFSALHWAAKAEELSTGAASNISFDPSSVSITATEVQEMGEELSDRTDVLVTGTLAVARGGTGVTTSTGTGATVRSASPAFTGNPTGPTQAAGNNSTRLATTAFVAEATAIETGTNANGSYAIFNNGVILQRNNYAVSGSSSVNGDITFPVSFSGSDVTIVGSVGVSSQSYTPGQRLLTQSVSVGVPTATTCPMQVFITNDTTQARRVQWLAEQMF